MSEDNAIYNIILFRKSIFQVQSYSQLFHKRGSRHHLNRRQLSQTITGTMFQPLHFFKKRKINADKPIGQGNINTSLYLWNCPIFPLMIICSLKTLGITFCSIVRGFPHVSIFLQISPKWHLVTDQKYSKHYDAVFFKTPAKTGGETTGEKSQHHIPVYSNHKKS